MDLDLKPSLESFYSPNRQPISPTWTDKDKGEDDADAVVTSDGEDQGSLQENDIENSNDNLCNEGINDALEWHNGIGTLAGSDLKFRMNSHGDIEVLTDPCDLDENSIGPEERNNEHMDYEVNSKNMDISQHETPEINPNAVESKKDSDISKLDTDREHTEFQDQKELSEPKSVRNLEISDQDGLKLDNEENEDEPALVTQTEDNMPDFDPVLKEDMACLLYENSVLAKTNNAKDNDILLEGAEAKLQAVALALENPTANPCEICGRTSRLGNRFCSRQCLGRHAAIKRRSNQLALNKKARNRRKKSVGRGTQDDVYYPHPNDVLTIVNGDSQYKNDLKIKIKVSAANENRADGSVGVRESSRRRSSPTSVPSTRAGRKKEFTWPTYLRDEVAEAAPVSAFRDLTGSEPFPDLKNNLFRIGMALEGVDPENESYICPLVVSEIEGFRIRLKFYEYSESYEFWRDADCPLIFPCGFCKETNRILRPPNGYKKASFDWDQYLLTKRDYPAPKECFSIVKNLTPKHKFKIGQKLEAVDKHNPKLICVANISDIIGDSLRINFDGWSEQYDYWCSSSSHFIRKVGWCEENNVALTVPKGFDELSKFNWEKFLIETMSTAADPTAFTTRTEHQFSVGMKLEAVDPRNRPAIRVATITDIDGFQARIHFDGWSDIYDFWTHLDNTDLHPARYCELTAHAMQPPVNMYGDPSNPCFRRQQQSSGCPIPGCSGLGHIKGAKYQNHYSEFGCPYSAQNFNKEIVKNRLTSTKAKKEITEGLNQIDIVETDDQLGARPNKIHKRKRTAYVDRYASPAMETKRRRNSYGNSDENTIITGDKELLRNSDIVSKWSVDEVAKFIEEVTNNPLYGKIFHREEMDGKALLMLTQADILTLLRIKLGPAVKIYHALLNIKADT